MWKTRELWKISYHELLVAESSGASFLSNDLQLALSERVTAALLCLLSEVRTDLWQDVGMSEEAGCGYCGDKHEPCGIDCDGINKPSLGAFLPAGCSVSRIVYFLLEQHRVVF